MMAPTFALLLVAFLVHIAWGQSCSRGIQSFINAQKQGKDIKVINCSGDRVGAIPRDINVLSNLVKLRLKNCQFAVSIPTEIGELTKLTELALSENKNGTTERGRIPTEVGNLLELEKISFVNSHRSGPIPTELGNLVKCTRLMLRSNDLTGTIPTELGILVETVQLTLGYNELVGTLPTELGMLTKMTELQVTDNHLVGKLPEELGRCAEMIQLYMRLNHFTGTIPSSYVRLRNIKSFFLAANVLTGTIPDLFPAGGALLKLYLWDNELTGPLPESLSNPPDMESVFLSGNKMTGSIPAWNFRSLRDLDLSNNAFSGTVPSLLSWFRSPSSLLLLGNQFSGMVPPIPGSFAKEVDVSSNMRFLATNEPCPQSRSACASGNCVNGFCQATTPAPTPTRPLCSMTLHAITQSNGVTEIDCPHTSFTGTIPATLWDLDLLVLNIPQHRLSGSIPSGIGKLSYLQHLNLGRHDGADGVGLTGSLPVDMGQLSQLRELDLGFNALTGPIPSEIGEFQHLTQLILEHNQFTGLLPGWVSSLESLAELKLLPNYFDESSIESLSAATLATDVVEGVVYGGRGSDCQTHNMCASNTCINQLCCIETASSTECSRVETPIPTTGSVPAPTVNPTLNPTWNPTLNPTSNPTLNPTKTPTVGPTGRPTATSTVVPPPTGNPATPPTTTPTVSSTTAPTTPTPTTTPPTSTPTTTPPTSTPTTTPPTSTPTFSSTVAPTTKLLHVEDDDFTTLIVILSVGGGVSLLILLASLIMHQSYYRFIAFLVAVMDIATDLVYAFHLLLLDDDNELRVYGFLAIAFVGSAMVANIVALSLFFQGKFKRDAEFREWSEQHATGVSLIRVVSTLSCDLFRVTSSRIHDLDLFSGPLTAQDDRWLTILGLINTVVEDIPQVVVVVLSSKAVGKVTSLSLITLTMSALSAVCSMVFRCSALQMYMLNRQEKTNQDGGPFDSQNGKSFKGGAEILRHDSSWQQDPQARLSTGANGPSVKPMDGTLPTSGHLVHRAPPQSDGDVVKVEMHNVEVLHGQIEPMSPQEITTVLNL